MLGWEKGVASKQTSFSHDHWDMDSAYGKGHDSLCQLNRESLWGEDKDAGYSP